MIRVFLGLVVFLTSIFALGGGSNSFLSAEEAFKIDAKIVEKNIVVDIKLGHEIHIYKDDLKFKITKPSTKDITESAKKPEGHLIDDVVGYDKDISINIPITSVESSEFTIEVTLQGCSDKGICYPPFVKSFDLKKVSGTTTVTQVEEAASEGDIVDTLKHGSLLKVLSLFFGFGLLLALTPCIFPMIPILSSIIVSASKEKKMSVGRGVFLSVVYVLSMSIAYTLAGVLAGLFGANIQTAMQNSYVLIGFSTLFIALAFSMFGFFEIQLPARLQNRLNSHSNSASDKGGIIGVAIMGFLSALIVGPCVAPALAGALVYIGQSGDALLGGAALFVMSIGMGMPLLLIGAGAGKFMPQPGGWMTRVSEIFGVVMLAIAIWMLDRVLDSTVMMFLWAMLLIGSGIYAGALEPFKDADKAIKFFRVFAFVLLTFGVFELVGAVSGATNPLDPFEKFTSGKVAVDDKISFKLVRDEAELMSIVNSSTKPVMIDFTAKWCASCKELEHITFADEKVKTLMKQFTLLKVDISDNSDADKQLLQKFTLFGPPALIFYKDKKELKEQKIIGYQPPEVVAPKLEKILGL